MKKTLTQNNAASDGQLSQIAHVINDAGAKVVMGFGLSRQGAQAVHAQGNKLARAVRSAVTEVLKEVTSSQPVRRSGGLVSNVGYTYTPIDIRTQVLMIRLLFPEAQLTTINNGLLAQIVEGKLELPKGAEGWFAIPNIWKSSGSYNDWVSIVLDKIGQALNSGTILCDSNYDIRRISERSVTNQRLKAVSKAQGDPDILIIPAQLGKRYAGRSAERVFRDMNHQKEYRLGVFASGCMLLTHLSRLQKSTDLALDCAGDIWRTDEGDYVEAPWFFASATGGLGLGKRPTDVASVHCGSATGFVI